MLEPHLPRTIFGMAKVCSLYFSCNMAKLHQILDLKDERQGREYAKRKEEWARAGERGGHRNLNMEKDGCVVWYTCLKLQLYTFTVHTWLQHLETTFINYGNIVSCRHYHMHNINNRHNIALLLSICPILHNSLLQTNMSLLSLQATNGWYGLSAALGNTR